MTGIIVAVCVWMPTIYSLIKSNFFETKAKKKERIESNKSIILLGKILSITKKRKNKTEKAVWDLFEAENNCQNVKERTIEYIAKKTSDPPQLLLEYK